MTRPFSTASIRLVADQLLTASPTTSVDAVLQKLAHLDDQIDRDFKALKSDLHLAHQQISTISTDLRHETSQRHHFQRLAEKQAAFITALKAKHSADSIPPVESGPKSLPLPKKQSHTDTTFQHHDKENNLTLPNTNSRTAPSARATHSVQCPLQQPILSDMDPRSLCILLQAREEAYRSQQALVVRLKKDNQELKTIYDKLWARYQNVYSTTKGPSDANSSADATSSDSPVAVNDRIEHLSVRIQQAGQEACNVASQVEQRLLVARRDVDEFRTTWQRLSHGVAASANVHFKAEPVKCANNDAADKAKRETRAATPQKANSVRDEYEYDEFAVESDLVMEMRLENERLNLAGMELMETLTLQQKAHDKLSATVVELTKELERIEPQRIQDGQKAKEKLAVMERELASAKSLLKKREQEIEDLKKQLKKVLAEYEAISIAHSYSNAELSRIRANSRAKTKMDRPRNDMPQRIGNSGVGEKHHFHRRNHFR